MDKSSVSKPNPLPTVLPPRPIQKSGVRAALEFTGIPVSWLSKRPKLPSRNWLIFLSVTSSIVGAYFYDRRQCKKIREAYVDRVKHLAEVPCDPMDWLRKVTVYGAKWPGDEEHDRSLKYFRKYIKPILVAAAIDFEQVGGKRHGEITTRVAKDIQDERRLAAGLDKPFVPPMSLPTYKRPEQVRAHKLEGGIILVGRASLKEFLAGVVQGWSTPLTRVDQEEVLSKALEEDRMFDEPEEPMLGSDEEAKPPLPTSPTRLSTQSPVFPPLQMKPPIRQTKTSTSLPTELDTPPTTIPEYPPLLLVPFTNYIGFTQIPLMILDFFTQRKKVQSGAECAYALVMNLTRPFDAPSSPSTQFTPDFENITSNNETSSESDSSSEPYSLQGGDLDFDLPAESYYKSSLSSFESDIQKARERYYASLPAKLVVARALARGTREPTKEERDHPPPTEVELRAERMKKELRWRADLNGWRIVWRDRKVAWDERLRGSLRVFVGDEEGSDNRS